MKLKALTRCSAVIDTTPYLLAAGQTIEVDDDTGAALLQALPGLLVESGVRMAKGDLPGGRTRQVAKTAHKSVPKKPVKKKA